MNVELPSVIVEPEPCSWPELVNAAASDSTEVCGRPISAWRHDTRAQLGIETDRPVIATGHQTLLWHPGILAKYFAMEAAAEAGGFARANLVVDQHVDDFGSFEIPIRREDGTLGTRVFHLATPRPGVPMSLHASAQPKGPNERMQQTLRTQDPTGTVAGAVDSIYAAVGAHGRAGNAALQMAGALSELMDRWVKPVVAVPSTALVETCLSRAILQKMVEDPQRCAQIYNAALRASGVHGIGSLLVRDDYVELPLWRIREDGRRMHAYDGDVEQWLDGAEMTLMPRALFLTAMVRLGMADLFIHGTGGGAYDRAMVAWIREWLGVEPAPAAVVSATLHLRFEGDEACDEPVSDAELRDATVARRRAWHNPELAGTGGTPGPMKAEALQAINDAPYGSPERRRAFRHLHDVLGSLRQDRGPMLQALEDAASILRRRQHNMALMNRRDWPFPLYSVEQLDALASALSCPGRSHDERPCGVSSDE